MYATTHGILMSQEMIRAYQRVERLKDISAKDCVDEGILVAAIAGGADHPDELLRTSYFDLWDRINGKKMPAATNPFVWVYEFPKYEETIS